MPSSAQQREKKKQNWHLQGTAGVPLIIFHCIYTHVCGTYIKYRYFEIDDRIFRDKRGYCNSIKENHSGYNILSIKNIELFTCKILKTKWKNKFAQSNFSMWLKLRAAYSQGSWGDPEQERGSQVSSWHIYHAETLEFEHDKGLCKNLKT